MKILCEDMLSSRPQLQSYIDSGVYDDSQISIISDGIEHGLTDKKLKILSNPEFNWQQMQVIFNGFAKGLSTRLVLLYARPEFNVKQMGILYLGTLKILSGDLTESQVALVSNPEYSPEHMCKILDAFLRGCSAEDVSKALDSSLSSTQLTALMDSILGF